MHTNWTTNGDNKINCQFKYFTFLSMLYCILLTASVLLPYKIINVFGFSAPGGIFIFPITYLLGGAIAETYGRKMALRMVWSSITCLFIFNLIIYVIVRIPSATNAPPHQEAFIYTFSSSLRLFFGCLVGLICSDLTNVYRITKLKLVFKGEYFIQRCLWSTALSEALFNIFCYTITYYGVIPNSELYGLMMYSWILKMIYSLLMIVPLLYLMKFLKAMEGADIFDVTENSGYIPEAIFLKFVAIANSGLPENAKEKHET